MAEFNIRAEFIPINFNVPTVLTTKTITANGVYDASQDSANGYSSVTVVVPPEIPTATISITKNGTYDVTNYATANVNTPTPPESYRAFQKDANGMLTNSTSTPWVPLPEGTTSVGGFCFSYAYINTPANVLSGVIDLSSLTSIGGESAFLNTFNNCPGITGANLSNLTTVTGSNACTAMFSRCTGLTSINLSKLSTLSGSYACSSMFNGCTSLTSVDLSSLTTITGTYGCQYMFQGCTALTSVDLSSLVTLGQYGTCMRMFSGCASLTSVNLSNLTTVSGSQAAQYMFNGCTSLTSVNLSKLTTVSDTSGVGNMFEGCTSLTSVNLSSLAVLTSRNACSHMFRGCTSLTSLSFPALTSNSFGTYTNQFQYMLKDVTGCTVHFPSNLQSVIGSWGDVLNGFSGTTTTVLFDLPETT